MHRHHAPSSANADVERFNRWAATYERSLMQRLFFGPVHARMLDLLVPATQADPPRRILDVGCGTGRLLRAAAARWTQAQLWGVDPAVRMLAEARRLNPKAIFGMAAAESLPLADESIDVVLSSLSFHHWADQARGLHEMTRVLRPGGWFCLADHTFPLARLVQERVRSREQVRALVSRAGLTLCRQTALRVRFVLITLAQK